MTLAQRLIGGDAESMSEDDMEGDNRSITIEKDAISSAIISGNGNKVVIYQYQLERLVAEEKTPPPGEIGANPYKGLLAFHEEDGDRYFGREEQIEKLWNLFRTLHENTTQPEAPLRLLAILGPSGSGKSSLARAGLIPELARRSLPGKSQVRVAVLVPGTHPVEALATVLARMATNDQTPVTKTKEFEQVLKETSNTTDTIIYDGLRRIASVLPEIAISPLVVLIDQFEEVYSLCKDITERQIFIENLIHAAGDRAGGVSVIITLRSDFLGETQRHPALNQVIANAEQGAIVPAMSEKELRRAITKPAELAGHPLDEAVVSLLLKDAQGREGALPLLQFALTRIWEGLKKGVEPIKTLKDIGGVGGALADEAQRIFDNLSEEEKKIARRVFLGLVQLGEGVSDTRLRANVNSLVSYKEQPEYVKRVIERFAHPGVRLVTLSSFDGKETAEVTHEALFANWGQMKEWLDSGRSDIRFQRRLDEAARVWDENSRPEGSLWRNPDLDLLGKFYQHKSDNMTPLQAEFFNASVNAEEARKQATIKAEEERKEKENLQIALKIQEKATKEANQLLTEARSKAKGIVRMGFLIMSTSILLGSIFIVLIPWLAIFFTNRGFDEYEKGQIKSAIQNYQIALVLKPDFVPALYNQGVAYEDLLPKPDYNSAIANYEYAIQKNEHYAPAYNNLARLYITQGKDDKDYKEAVEILNKALGLSLKNLDREDSAAYKNVEYAMLKNLGWAQLKLKFYSEAALRLNQAINLDDRRASAYCLLAQVKENSNNKIEAEKEWKKCLQFVDPDTNNPDEKQWIIMAKQRLKV